MITRISSESSLSPGRRHRHHRLPWGRQVHAREEDGCDTERVWEEIGVERVMIDEGDGGAPVEEWVEFAIGCVCCTVKHSLVQALEQLLQRKERLDHRLLENTGLADPAPLASIIWLDDQLESAVVDAKHIHVQLDVYRNSASFREAFLQIAFVDVLILYKVDLIRQENSGLPNSYASEDLEKAIHDINSFPNVIPSVHCQVDLNKILDCQAYGAKNLAHLEDLLHESKDALTRSCHDFRVRTLCIYEQQPVDLTKVRLWIEDRTGSSMDDRLWENKSNIDIYHSKGILYVHNSDQLHTLQAVRELYEVEPACKWSQTENQMNKIVFIGCNLDENVLHDSFKYCILLV